jgi:hypothetical protein
MKDSMPMSEQATCKLVARDVRPTPPSLEFVCDFKLGKPSGEQSIPSEEDAARFKIPARAQERGWLQIRPHDVVKIELDKFKRKGCIATLITQVHNDILVRTCSTWWFEFVRDEIDNTLLLEGEFSVYVEELRRS